MKHIYTRTHIQQKICLAVNSFLITPKLFTNISVIYLHPLLSFSCLEAMIETPGEKGIIFAFYGSGNATADDPTLKQILKKGKHFFLWECIDFFFFFCFFCDRQKHLLQQAYVHTHVDTRYDT